MLLGLFLETRRERRFPRREASSVSIVIPARNEADRIGPLFKALGTLSYPALEIVFVDDRSTDGTMRLIEEFAASQPEGRVRVLRLTENPGPNFKQYALGKGIRAASGELLLFTDADCTFAPGWVSAMAAAMADGRNGLAIGPVFKPVTGSRFVDFFQAFDHTVRYSYLSGSAGLGFPSGGFGNNLIVRRETLEGIGGYETVPFSPTEDAALIACVRAKTSYRVRGLLSPASRVVTTPEPGWRELVRQGLRWNNGGLFAPDPATMIAFNYLMLVITLGILFAPLVPFLPALGWFTAAAYWAIVADTLAAASFSAGILPRPFFRWLPHSFLMPPYFAFLTLLGYLGIEVSWKDSTIAKK